MVRRSSAQRGREVTRAKVQFVVEQARNNYAARRAVVLCESPRSDGLDDESWVGGPRSRPPRARPSEMM